jgi:hypothetical protein
MSPMETPEICLVYPWETPPQFPKLLASTYVGDITRMSSLLWPLVATASCDVHGDSSLLPNGHDSNGRGYDVTQDRCH